MINISMLEEDLNRDGYSLIKNYRTPIECDEIKELFEKESLFRKVVSMERYRFGKGDYKYFHYPLPKAIEKIKQEIYPYLVNIANHWMLILKKDIVYPNSLDDFTKQCKEVNQTLPTALILRYERGGFNTLHQDIYGKIFFPFQIVLCLSKVNQDFSGGEFVITESQYRAQSRAKVISADKGDLLVITTNFRPILGKKGYSMSTVKHGVSTIHAGERFSLGIIFHDAVS
ncbi:hypothetical protein LPTSP4_31310 [Leptospira ryugenii]|uniref:Fe2OG dioxygenase domain-containing protein n=1 Tax=Leptospira ryugenii TaxID=1917863 RepID=A0A2P2E3Y4_9LEPT|nr:2OG-Fe(II) oxygenase [Leptospira ryugenii]GBF51593.1 hypothetical protein LPTSP4_31310 [Leptospira ryugenii]